MSDNTLLTFPHTLLLTLSLCGTFLSGADLRELQPEYSFQVANSLSSPLPVKVREMRASKIGFWFLVDSTDSKYSQSIANTDLKGSLRTRISVPADSRSMGLVPTAEGVASVLVRRRQGILTQYDAQGKLLSEAVIPCYGGDALLGIDGRVATACSDGTLTIYSGSNAASRKPSWARPGSFAVPLSTGTLAIVDQSTAQVLLNDLESNTISTLSERVPEIDEALRKTALSIQEGAMTRRPGDPPPGRSMIVMNAASDATGFYLLIYPYHVSVGPAVVRFNNTGVLTARYRCRIPGQEASGIHRIEVQNGYLFLASVAGNVYVYSLKPR